MDCALDTKKKKKNTDDVSMTVGCCLLCCPLFSSMQSKSPGLVSLILTLTVAVGLVIVE